MSSEVSTEQPWSEHVNLGRHEAQQRQSVHLPPDPKIRSRRAGMMLLNTD